MNYVILLIELVLLATGVGVFWYVFHQPPPPRPEWKERDWSAFLAERLNGDPEWVLPDGSRIDILTEDIAWEVEWSDKWPEAIGQSVFYAMAMDRKPGVYLLLRGNKDEDWLRCMSVCRKLEIEFQWIKTS